MRKALVVTAVTAVGLVGALQGTAHAGDTTTTFVLTAGGIGISVPSSATMNSAAAGATTDTGSLGNVTVTDARGSLVSTWTATVSTTDFTTGTATADETVAQANVGYASGVGTAALGQVGAMTPTGAVTPVALGSAATGASWTGVGNNTVTWNPTLTFTLLPSQVAGTYTGTITHSVS